MGIPLSTQPPSISGRDACLIPVGENWSALVPKDQLIPTCGAMCDGPPPRRGEDYYERWKRERYIPPGGGYGGGSLGLRGGGGPGGGGGGGGGGGYDSRHGGEWRHGSPHGYESPREDGWRRGRSRGGAGGYESPRGRYDGDWRQEEARQRKNDCAEHGFACRKCSKGCICKKPGTKFMGTMNGEEFEGLMKIEDEESDDGREKTGKDKKKKKARSATEELLKKMERTNQDMNMRQQMMEDYLRQQRLADPPIRSPYPRRGIKGGFGGGGGDAGWAAGPSPWDEEEDDEVGEFAQGLPPALGAGPMPRPTRFGRGGRGGAMALRGGGLNRPPPQRAAAGAARFGRSAKEPDWDTFNQGGAGMLKDFNGDPVTFTYQPRHDDDAEIGGPLDPGPGPRFGSEAGGFKGWGGGGAFGPGADIPAPGGGRSGPASPRTGTRGGRRGLGLSPPPGAKSPSKRKPFKESVDDDEQGGRAGL
ncbi:hypothetical protein W97_07640 [Coniosporium apollinis CBS 100218]|uniref:Uncharacterized protein n=1 Tax=Coniosporium apollinis (strain CBS 100218) TaxID=1168221 RepID=R7Z2I7_CONA1|nr:uncharacterized protein W97_07640 [Coniosporium apollinis CBS 100218]EON68382.1 hypothetical protein W97_07640 [Coniosporium apollinis CBS 100218]